MLKEVVSDTGKKNKKNFTFQWDVQFGIIIVRIYRKLHSNEHDMIQQIEFCAMNQVNWLTDILLISIKAKDIQ